MDDIFAEIAQNIIAQQESIIGPVAVQQAMKINDFNIDWEHRKVKINGNAKRAIDDLVGEYKSLFGQAAVETCKDAAKRYLPQIPLNQMPSSFM